VCLLVHDLDRAVEDYKRILRVLDPGQVTDTIVYQRNSGIGDERFDCATFVSSGCEIQLMEPKTPDTALYNRLQKRGEHVHHICFTTNNLPDAIDRLAEEGVASTGPPIHDPEVPWAEWTFVHPEHSHGVLIEVAKHYRAVDGVWKAGEDVVD
jgi:methylmalonyl-CoA/ethylmalonyl-CoA epimerase